MRIFIIARGYPTKHNPQWGCFEKDQALALARLGHEVVILSYRQHPFLPNIGYRVIEDNGIRSVSYNILPGRIFGQHGAWLRVRFEQWELTKAYMRAVELYGKPDIIYSHYLFVSVIAVCLREKFHVPIVAIEHWSELNREPMRNYVRKIATRTYPAVNQLLTVSEPLQERIASIFNVRSIVVHNMISSEFSQAETRYPDKFNLISVGSLFPVKNHALLVSALALLDLPKDQWQLTIIGEGGERQNLQRKINESGLSDNIHLVGQKSKEEVAQFLRSSSVFVLPSKSENFSVAVLEALSCGLPVIASICGGIRECIDKKNGLLFEVDDVQGLADSLQYMYEHHREYDRQAIAADCKARFSSEVIAKQLTVIFEDVIMNRETN